MTRSTDLVGRWKNLLHRPTNLLSKWKILLTRTLNLLRTPINLLSRSIRTFDFILTPKPSDTQHTAVFSFRYTLVVFEFGCAHKCLTKVVIERVFTAAHFQLKIFTVTNQVQSNANTQITQQIVVLNYFLFLFNSVCSVNIILKKLAHSHIILFIITVISEAVCRQRPHRKLAIAAPDQNGYLCNNLKTPQIRQEKCSFVNYLQKENEKSTQKLNRKVSLSLALMASYKNRFSRCLQKKKVNRRLHCHK